MITLGNPEFSFIQFGNNSNDVLPIIDIDDIAFQVTAQCDTADQATTLAASEASLYLVKYDAVITDGASLAANKLIDFAANPPYDPALRPELHRLDNTKVLVFWPHGLPAYADTIDLDQCFRLCLVLHDPETDADKYYTSNLFKRIDDTQFSSQLGYSCDEDAYGFSYCNFDIYNRVRLPFYLRKPQFQDEETVYYKSNGARKLIKSTTRKLYEAFTELLTEQWHEKLKLALSHDNVDIKSEKYTGGISKDGSYEIDWPEFMNFLSASAKFKVIVTPYNQRNSNCADCQPYSPAGGGGGSCEITASGVAVIDGVYTTVHTFIATWTNTGGSPDHATIEVSYDNGVTWSPINAGTQTDDHTWEYDLGTSGPVSHLAKITPYCDDTNAGTSAIGPYAEAGCGTPTDVVIDILDNGDGTQTLTIHFDLLPAAAAPLQISRSTDGVTWTNSFTGSIVSPRTYTMPIGKFYIKLESLGTCSGQIIFANVGIE
jgi:hypothetical protein